MGKFLLLTLLALTACSHAPRALRAPRSAAELAPLQACQADSDCVRVDNGCCDCANNGGTVAIHRKFEREFRESFDCRGIVCTQRSGACIFLEPVCREGRCELGHRPKKFPRK